MLPAFESSMFSYHVFHVQILFMSSAVSGIAIELGIVIGTPHPLPKPHQFMRLNLFRLSMKGAVRAATTAA